MAKRKKQDSGESGKKKKKRSKKTTPASVASAPKEPTVAENSSTTDPEVSEQTDRRPAGETGQDTQIVLSESENLKSEPQTSEAESSENQVPIPAPQESSTQQSGSTDSFTLPVHGTIWRRLFAFLFDITFLVLLGMLCFGLRLGFALHNFSEPLQSGDEFSFLRLKSSFGLLFFGYGIFVWLYFTLSEALPCGATLGKYLFSIRVSDSEGKTPSLFRANLRFFGKFLSLAILGIGFLLPFFQKNRQSLHDRIAKTFVIRKLGPNE